MDPSQWVMRFLVSPEPEMGVRETQRIAVSLGNVTTALVFYLASQHDSMVSCTTHFEYMTLMKYCHYLLFGKAKLIFFLLYIQCIYLLTYF